MEYLWGRTVGTIIGGGNVSFDKIVCASLEVRSNSQIKLTEGACCLHFE
jgi:hypothetical protein